MSKEPRKPKVEKLELDKETLADLTEEEAEGVQGGAAVVELRRASGTCPTVVCLTDGCMK